jgi:hypothetical protein
VCQRTGRRRRTVEEGKKKRLGRERRNGREKHEQKKKGPLRAVDGGKVWTAGRNGRSMTGSGG